MLNGFESTSVHWAFSPFSYPELLAFTLHCTNVAFILYHVFDCNLHVIQINIIITRGYPLFVRVCLMSMGFSLAGLYCNRPHCSNPTVRPTIMKKKHKITLGAYLFW